MEQIRDILGREVLDSRGLPTVEVEICLEDDIWGRAIVPSGASTGRHEALELRDGGKRFGGKGVRAALDNVEMIKNVLVDQALTQEQLDQRLRELDGTPNKSKLGANAVLGVSLAFAHAAARRRHLPLYRYFAALAGTEHGMRMPVPLMNFLNGGRHAERSADLQEFMIIPLGAPSFGEALRWGAEIFQALKNILSREGLATTVGDEGGFAPAVSHNEQGLQWLLQAVEEAGYQAGRDVAFGLDAAASEFFKNGQYELRREGRNLAADELIGLYEIWAGKYPLISIEDGLAEDDWEGHKLLTARLGRRLQLVGDDLFVTSPERLKRGIAEQAANAILIKLNQIGTVTETLQTVSLARAAGYGVIISHRSGETEDTTIADLAVGLGAGQIKTGSLTRGERTAKYNQLLRIEQQAGQDLPFAGRSVFAKTDGAS